MKVVENYRLQLETLTQIHRMQIIILIDAKDVVLKCELSSNTESFDIYSK